MTGCGGSSSKPAASGALSGNWQMTLLKTDTTTIYKTQTGSLIQTGDDITGSVISINDPCSGVGSVTGSVSGDSVALSISPVGTSVTLSGTIANPPKSMSGTYTILSLGCAGSQTAPQVGNFTANLVSPVSGNITGTFAGKNSGPTYAVTGTVTQGANTGQSSTPLTGSLTFAASGSGPGFCYASANIVGSISGTSVVMNLVQTDGSQIGQIFGTATLDGTLVAGTYDYLGLGKGAGSNCVDGSSGAVNFSIAGS
jgi:hypothetical protein